MEASIVREILKKNEDFLKRHLILSKTVLDKLHSNGLITDVIRRKILVYPGYKQVPLLLESMDYQGLHSLRKFIGVLRETGHRYLADLILDTEAIPVADLRPGTASYSGSSFTDDMGLTRPTRTVHSPVRGHKAVVSLGQLLRQREERDVAPRGAVVPRTLLSHPLTSAPYAVTDDAAYTWAPRAPRAQTHVVSRKEDIPSTLYGLGQVFTAQLQDNEQAMKVLRQEEMAIKQLLEQNARDQQKVRRKQYAIDDINKRLKDIGARASDMYDPAPDPNIGRYRLAQLNQIPWSVDS
ncbi:uncharacterized protein LOC112555150 [Pomacea canaliculata]|uniref:uncharacterized protein LOC112555150 n=1 Tax=Pomacea canaliculata TaxID=400727 RepID=UPI000D727BCC|nr:uncharacterized protein LOC112555150 [Pomacea canaliculata]XP_025079173.1 uncharacterized protein LOC112555150 [Pomacea canaliculata]XP_025079174.1 uncharacterized protein LOC112555150 [Pomacea canaliculata]